MIGRIGKCGVADRAHKEKGVMGVYKAWSEGARGRNEERKDTSEVADTIMAREEIAAFHGNPFRESYPTIRFF